MKVVIVSTPRTCSYLMLNMFCSKFDLKSLTEYFTNAWEGTAKEKLSNLIEWDNYGVKITSTSFIRHESAIQYNTFPWHMYDYIVLTERVNMAQQCASWLLLNYGQNNDMFASTTRYIYPEEISKKLQHPEEIPFDEGLLEYTVKTIAFFNLKTKPFLLSQNLPVYSVTHELLQNEPSVYIPQLNKTFGIEFTEENIRTPKYEIDYTPFIVQYDLENRISEIYEHYRASNKTDF